MAPMVAPRPHSGSAPRTTTRAPQARHDRSSGQAVIAPRYAYYVWGLQYIDELIQVNVADNRSGGASFVHQGVLHDPQYSVLRLVAWDEDGSASSVL